MHLARQRKFRGTPLASALAEKRFAHAPLFSIPKMSPPNFVRVIAGRERDAENPRITALICNTHV
jgi:hypothetical protein